MSVVPRVLAAAAIVVASSLPLAARADYSQCTQQIRAQGYFITDIDSDWGRPYDKFSTIKDNNEYDLWVDKNTCKIVHKVLDNDRYRY